MTYHYAIFSDVHAVHPALVQVTEELAQLPTRHIPIFLGDVVGYGTQPRQTVLELYEYMQAHPDGLALLGNHDALMLSLSDFVRNSSNHHMDDAIAQLVRQHFAALQEDKDMLDWLSSLRPQSTLPQHEDILLAHDEFVIHTQELKYRKWGYATKDSQAAKVQARNLNRRAHINFRALFVGHRHTPALYQYNQKESTVTTYDPMNGPHIFDYVDHMNPLIVNVGSIALPRAEANATYVLLTINTNTQITVEFRHVLYPTETPLQEISKATYPEALRAKVSGWIKNV